MRRAGLMIRQLIPKPGVPGTGCMPGVCPSQSPAICYRMWSGCSYPILFEDVSRSEMEAAFRLWFQDLGQALPDALASEDSEDSLSDDDASYECSSCDEQSLSDAESESESERGSSQNRSEPLAAARDSSSHISPASPASPTSSCNLVDVDPASSASETGDDDDSDWDPRAFDTEDVDSRPPSGPGLFSRAASIHPPSPSVESTDAFSLALTEDDYSQPETDAWDLAEDAAADDSYLGLRSAYAVSRRDSISFPAGSLFDVLNADVEPHGDYDASYSLALPGLRFGTSSHPSSGTSDGSRLSAEPREYGGDYDSSAQEALTECLDDAAATLSDDGSLFLESLFDLEDLISSADAAEEPELVEYAPASTHTPSDVAMRPSTSSGTKRGKKPSIEVAMSKTRFPSPLKDRVSSTHMAHRHLPPWFLWVKSCQLSPSLGSSLGVQGLHPMRMVMLENHSIPQMAIS